MSFDLEHEEREVETAMKLHRRHISEEQMRRYEGYITEIFTAFGLDLETPATPAGVPAIRRALALDPTSAWAYVLRGVAFAAGEEYQQALADFDRALALDPGNAQAYAGRGHVYLEVGEIERARADLLRSQELAPHDGYVGLLLEWLNLCREEVFPQRPDLAERLEALARSDRQQPAASVCRGVALLLRKHFEEALAILDQVLLTDPQRREALFWKSLVCAELRRDEEAVAALERAKTSELPLPEELFAPLHWLEQERPDFYRAYAAPVLAHTKEGQTQRA